MVTLGIAVTRDRLLAVALEGAAPAPRVAAVVAVPCREPFGGPEDPAALVAELRNALPGTPLPGAVITLPPSLTYLRTVRLPVKDLARARAIHLAELEGNLPIEDDEILSDLLPASPETPDSFLAVACARSSVEKTANAFQAAGIRVDRIITDHTAILLLASAETFPDTQLLSAVPDILLLRVSGGGVLAARQFPADLAGSPSEILAVVESAGAGGPPPPVVAVGDLPAALAGAIPGLSSVMPPEGVPASHLSACGAALAPLLPKAAGGFSLRTSAEAAAVRIQEGRRVRVAAAAAIAAVVLAVAALQFSVWVSGEKVSRTRAQVRKEFNAAAPDVKSVVQAGTQIREKLASLRRLQKELGTDAPPVSDLLSLASASLPQGEISVREASVEGGRVRLVGEAGEAGLVESYRAALASAFGPDYVASVQGSEGSAKGSAVKFTILVEKKEDRRAS